MCSFRHHASRIIRHPSHLPPRSQTSDTTSHQSALSPHCTCIGSASPHLPHYASLSCTTSHYTTPSHTEAHNATTFKIIACHKYTHLLSIRCLASIRAIVHHLTLLHTVLNLPHYATSFRINSHYFIPSHIVPYYSTSSFSSILSFSFSLCYLCSILSRHLYSMRLFPFYPLASFFTTYSFQHSFSYHLSSPSPSSIKFHFGLSSCRIGHTRSVSVPLCALLLP